MSLIIKQIQAFIYTGLQAPKDAGINRFGGDCIVGGAIERKVACVES
jgi:hypothetical protein